MLTLKYQLGVGLIEVLVALFIVTIALVSMAKIINSNLMDHANIFNHTAATLLINDMAERIKSNSKQDYTIESTMKIPVDIDKTCTLKRCNPLQLKQFDINQWLFLMDQQLPSASALIKKEALKYTIELTWNGFDQYKKGAINKLEVEINI